MNVILCDGCFLCKTKFSEFKIGTTPTHLFFIHHTILIMKRRWMDPMIDDDENDGTTTTRTPSTMKRTKLDHFTMMNNEHQTNATNHIQNNPRHNNNNNDQSPTATFMNYIQEQLSNFTFSHSSSSSSSNKWTFPKDNDHTQYLNDHNTTIVDVEHNDDDSYCMIEDCNDNHAPFSIMIKQSEKKQLYHIDLQYQLLSMNHQIQQQQQQQTCYLVNENPIIQFMQYKMTKRFQLETVEWNDQYSVMTIPIKSVSGIVNCITPKTEMLKIKLYSNGNRNENGNGNGIFNMNDISLPVHCISYSHSNGNRSMVTLQVNIPSSIPLSQLPSQSNHPRTINDHSQCYSHLKIEQWMDKERNRQCNHSIPLFNHHNHHSHQNNNNNHHNQMNNEIIPYLNLYEQFNLVYTGKTNEPHNFEQLAIQYLHERDFGGFNLLMHYACRNDVCSTMKLIELGYDIHQRDSLGYNTMYWCFYYASFDVIQAILNSLFISHSFIPHSISMNTTITTNNITNNDNNITTNEPLFPLDIQVDDPSRLQLNEYNWKHFYLSKFNSTCIITCKQIIPIQQILRVKMCDSYSGRVTIQPSETEPDHFHIQFTHPNYNGAMVIQLFDLRWDRLVAESEFIHVYDTSSIYGLMNSDLQMRRVPSKKQNYRHLFLRK